jgi:hypothetical protein
VVADRRHHLLPGFGDARRSTLDDQYLSFVIPEA